MLKLTPLRFVLLLGALHLLCASLSFAASTTAATGTSVTSPRQHLPLEATWKMGLSGIEAQSLNEDSESSSKYVSFGIEAQSRYWLHPQAFLSFAPVVKFENGSYQSLNGERAGESSLTLKEAGAHWRFAEDSTLSAGALNQATTHSELLIGDQAFPALRMDLQVFKNGAMDARLGLEQAIPTSSSLSTQTKETESTPRFLSASVSLDYEGSRAFWKTRVGAFSYEHLPGAVGYESGLRGNSTIALTENEALFIHQYQGLEGMTALRFPLLRACDLMVELSYIENQKAPRDLNRAYAATAGTEVYFSGQKSLEMKLTGFRIEPDAAVAFFSSNRFYNTNRAGYSLQSFVNFNKYGFHLGGRYTEAEVIYLSPVQTREKSLMLILETSHADI